MDAMKKLKIEYGGFKNTITTYSGDANNIFEQLEEAIKSEDKETVLYVLNMLNHWYEKNQSDIQSNQYASNKGLHLENQARLISFYKEIEESAIKNSKILNEVIKGTGTMKKIFISHSAVDETVCTAFVELLEELGVPEEDILYTSSNRHGVPGDINIFSYLKKYIVEGITVFYMLSDNYYRSPYCLNEMGAAWVIQNESSTFLLPKFNGEIKGVIDNQKKAFSLKTSIELIEVKKKILGMYPSSKITEGKWEKIKSDFFRKQNEI